MDNDHDLHRAMVTLLEGQGITVLDTEALEDAIALIDRMDFDPGAKLIDSEPGADVKGSDFVFILQRRFGWRPARIISAERSPALSERSARVVSDPIPALGYRDDASFLSNVNLQIA